MNIQHQREIKILNNPSFEKRFYSKIKIENDCHIWTGATKSSGYGIITIGKRNEGLISSNRAAYILYHQISINENYIILHSCNNKLCCNPKHLSEGTHSDNIKQAYNDGLRKIGETHQFAKLSNEDVIIIKNMKEKGFSYSQIHQIYNNVTQHYLYMICSGRNRRTY
jgi:hypothetical protein